MILPVINTGYPPLNTIANLLKNQDERQAQAQQTETNWQQAQPLLNQVRKLDTTLGQKKSVRSRDCAAVVTAW